jgi:hypothetical protein
MSPVVALTYCSPIQRDDESVATVALRGIQILDRSDVAAAKKHFAYWIGSYYRVYHANDETNLIARIESAATTNPGIAVGIVKNSQ